jgi:hypothetical protein
MGHLPGPSGDVDAIIDAIRDERRVILARLRELIHAADPEILEAAKWRKPSSPLGAAVFEHDGIVCILIPLKGRVRISFVEGSRLPDPKKLFNAQLNGISRAIDFPVGVEIDAASVKALVRAGVERRRRGAPPPGKGPQAGCEEGSAALTGLARGATRVAHRHPPVSDRTPTLSEGARRWGPGAK